MLLYSVYRLYEGLDMSNDLTPSEARFVRALCGSGPLGLPPLGMARALGVTSATVINLSVVVERKGFCTRERFGMRIFLRPTNAALAFNASCIESPELMHPPPEPRKKRAPRAPRAR
jgi:hypothetical protein